MSEMLHDEIEQLREENERLRSEVKHKEGLAGLAADSLGRKNRIIDESRIENQRLREENEQLRKEVKDLQSVLRSYQLGFADEQ